MEKGGQKAILFNGNCNKLSKLAEIAVDTAKHGKIVTNDEFKDFYTGLEWPDFMGK